MTSKALSGLGPAGRLSLENVSSEDEKPWDDTTLAIATARAELDALGRHESCRPGDRRRVASALLDARSALVTAAGELEEARGLSRRVDAERIEG